MNPQENTGLAVQNNQGMGLQVPTMFVPTGGIFASDEHFRRAEKFAQILAASTLVPEAYRKNPENCMIALDFAGNVGVPPMMVMQNLDIVKGKPGFNAKFILAAIRGCGRYKNVHHVHGQDGVVAKAWVAPQQGSGREVQNVPNLTCYLSATDVATGQEVRSPVVSIQMAVSEGWYGSPGSKWHNMPTLMLEYRTGSFFGRTQISDILLGMASGDELEDVAGSMAGGSDAGTGAEVLPGLEVKAASQGRGPRERRAAPSYAPATHTDERTTEPAPEAIAIPIETAPEAENAAPVETTEVTGPVTTEPAVMRAISEVPTQPAPVASPAPAPAGFVFTPQHFAVLIKIVNDNPTGKELTEVQRALVKEFGTAYPEYITLPSRVTGRFVITQAGNEWLAEQIDVYNAMQAGQGQAAAETPAERENRVIDEMESNGGRGPEEWQNRQPVDESTVGNAVSKPITTPLPGETPQATHARVQAAQYPAEQPNPAAAFLANKNAELAANNPPAEQDPLAGLFPGAPAATGQAEPGGAGF